MYFNPKPRPSDTGLNKRQGLIPTKASTPGHGWRVGLTADMLNNLAKTSKLDSTVSYEASKN